MIKFFYTIIFYVVSVTFISDNFSYVGINIAYDISGFLFYIFLISCYFFILRNAPHDIEIVLVIYLITIFAPSILLLTNSSNAINFFDISLFFIFPTIMRSSAFLPSIIFSKKIQVSPKILTFGVFLLCIFILSFDFRGFSLNFDSIYESREEILLNSYWHDLAIIVTKVFLPVIFFIALYRKHLLTIIFCYALYLFFFMAYSHRSFLIYPLLIHALFYISVYKNNDFSRVILLGMIAIFIICIANYLLTENIFLASLLMRRGIYSPSLITLDYIYFFKSNPFYFWEAYGISSRNYMIPLSQITTDTSGANTGLLGSGFAQAGILGVILYSIIFALMIKIISSAIIEDNGSKYSFMIPSLPVVLSAIVNSDLVIALGTHGLLEFILFCLFIRIVYGSKNMSGNISPSQG